MNLRALLQQLKNRPQTKNPPVVAILPFIELTNEKKAQVIHWLQDIIENLASDAPEALAFAIAGVHSEYNPVKDEFEQLFIKLSPPIFFDEDEDVHTLN